MIVFELTMPHVGSWNGKWTGTNQQYIRTRKERAVPKELWDKDFFYRWPDGWEACVSVRRMKAPDARRLKKSLPVFGGMTG